MTEMTIMPVTKDVIFFDELTIIRTGDWQTDCANGREYARKMIAKIQDSCPSNLNFFGNAMKAIAAGGVFGGVEVGFFQQIAEFIHVQDASI